MELPPGKKIYFISDFHLGAPDAEQSLEREKRIVRFLESIQHQAHTIFIVGDMFDFWYEYRKVVPRGFVRLLGKIASLADAGIQFHFFVGNHDMWMKDYFQKELNVPVYFEPASFEFNSRQFLVGHGDGLGPGDHGYKRLKKIFRNPVCQWLFGVLPPVIGIGIANYASQRSRAATGQSEENFLGEDKEWLLIYCRESSKKNNFKYYVFGHRHLPIDYRLDNGSRYINLGDWIHYDTYAVFDGNELRLESWSGNGDKIIRNS
ncbi:MAG: UDP-2,3-diacylglucosamine diphosphatase [Flavisolibacter sp.]